MSQGVSPSKNAAAERNLVPSITEPPPTASRKSMFLDFITAKASIRIAYSGFGGIPPNSETVYPFRASVT